MSFLAEFYDPSLEVDETETPAAIETAELQRLARNINLASLVASIPRRLGADADADALALDKKRAKRALHAERQCYSSWGGDTLPSPDEELAREAAQMDWKAWGEAQDAWLAQRTRYLVTWGRKTGSDEAWVKSAVVRLQNERRWLSYALRD